MLYLLTFTLVVAIIALMAVGVIFGQSPIKGSCGGLNDIGIDHKCDCQTRCSDGSTPNTKELYQINEPTAKPRN